MVALIEALLDKIAEVLRAPILFMMECILGQINSQLEFARDLLGLDPETFNGEVFTMMENLSRNVALPIGGTLLGILLAMELIQMLTDRNNMHDLEPVTLGKWIFKAVLGIVLLQHAWDLVLGILAIGQWMVGGASTTIEGISPDDIDTLLTAFSTDLETQGIGQLVMLLALMLIATLISYVVYGVVFVYVYGRFIKIYITTCVAPVPMSTLMSREYNNIGVNYIKTLAAFALEGFLVLVCLGIYTALLTGIDLGSGTDLMFNVFELLFCNFLVIYAMLQCSSLAKSFLSAH